MSICAPYSKYKNIATAFCIFYCLGVVLVAIYILIGKKKILKKLLTKKYYGGPIRDLKFKSAALAAAKGVQYENGIADCGKNHCD